MEHYNNRYCKIVKLGVQWNPSNMTNHGTDVGRSCYRGGRVSEVENRTIVSLACMIEVMHEALFMTKIVIIIESIILS
jgi:hypothetical protein